MKPIRVVDSDSGKVLGYFDRIREAKEYRSKRSFNCLKGGEWDSWVRFDYDDEDINQRKWKHLTADQKKKVGTCLKEHFVIERSVYERIEE
jgi:hypothetical protein